MAEAVLEPRLASIRQQLVELANAHACGEIDAARYERERRVAERALSDALLEDPVVRPSVRPSRRLVIGTSAFVVVLAIAGYAFTGSPRGDTTGGVSASTAAAPAAADAERQAGLAQIAAMVDKLAQRLKDQPDDAQGWVMLARSYNVLGRFDDAVPAYRRAMALNPKDAGLLADYADALAAQNGGRPTDEALQSIDRALALDPAQPKALALSGTVAFDRGDFATAAKQWQKIADALPPGSEFRAQVMENVDEARRRGGLAPATKSTGPARKSDAAAGPEALTGTVALSPSLAAKASPSDTVFVLARAEGARMPLAVVRATVADLPLSFTLDDRMAMTQAGKLSGVAKAVVVARVSKSGNPIAQPGDLSGESAPVAPGTRGLSITIANEVEAK